jgi:hypothetical protein
MIFWSENIWHVKYEYYLCHDFFISSQQQKVGKRSLVHHKPRYTSGPAHAQKASMLQTHRPNTKDGDSVQRPVLYVHSEYNTIQDPLHLTGRHENGKCHYSRCSLNHISSLVHQVQKSRAFHCLLQGMRRIWWSPTVSLHKSIKKMNRRWH